MVAVVPMTAAPTHKIVIMKMTNTAAPGTAIFVIFMITILCVGAADMGAAAIKVEKASIKLIVLVIFIGVSSH